MRLRWILTIGLAGLGVWWLWPTPEAPKAGLSSEVVEAHLVVLPNAPVQPAVFVNDQIMTEVSTRQYSDDPYLEWRAISRQMSVCHPAAMEMLFADVWHTAKFQAYNQQLKTRCDVLKKIFPAVFAATNRPTNEIQVPANSELGRLKQNRPSFSPTDQEARREYELMSLALALKVGNGFVLTQYRNSGFAVEPMVEALGLNQVLKSQDHRYVGMVERLAREALGCEFHDGAACSSTSDLMMLKCADDLSTCGLDFSAWYAAHVLPGMDADVMLVKNLYRQWAGVH